MSHVSSSSQYSSFSYYPAGVTEDQRINVVQPSNMPIPGIGFDPSDAQVLDYLKDVKQGNSKIWDNYVTKFVNILEFKPADLPGMDSKKKAGYYLCERKRKTNNPKCKKFNREKKVGENSKWHEWDVKEIDVQDNRGRKRSFRHQVNKQNTGWLMKEYELDSTDLLVFCKIYMREEKNQGHGRCPRTTSKGVPKEGPLKQSSKLERIYDRSSDCIPKLNQSQNAAANSSSSAAPDILGTDSGFPIQLPMNCSRYHSQNPAAATSNMSGQFQSFDPTGLSLSAVHNIDPEKLDDYTLFAIANHCLAPRN